MEELIDLQLMIFSLIAIGLIVKKIGMVGTAGQKNLTDLIVNLILYITKDFILFCLR